MSETRITVLDQLDQLEEIVLLSSRIPFSGNRLVNEQDAIEAMDALRDALPPQISQAEELLRQREGFIEKARQQAEEIVAQARREREQLIHSSTIRQEAERQAGELREQARQKTEQLLAQARAQAAQAEQEHHLRMAQMEQAFAGRRQQLEQEAQTRRQQLEAEAIDRSRQLMEQHERVRQQSLQELEAIRQEGLRVQRDTQTEAERLHQEALQFRQQTQQQCDAMVTRTRQEAGSIQDGANRYAEQVLGELETRLKDLSQIVLGGRRELMRLQGKDGTITPAGALPPGSSKSDGGTLPPAVDSTGDMRDRARQAANRLRKAAGRRLAS
jgi:F0F1-type ATP synthase membrane subunit b/b'